jgi:DNA-binding CsgD family transcriptional regulator
MLSRRTNLHAIAIPPEPTRAFLRDARLEEARPPRIALNVAASLVAGATLVTDDTLRVLRKDESMAAFERYLGVSGDHYFFRHTRHRKEFDALMAEGAAPASGGEPDSRVCSRSFFGDDDNETLIKLRKISNQDGVFVILSLIGVTTFHTFDDVLLRELYGLTSAESRVATYLYNGICIKEIAERNNASVATVRDQLASVFQKTRVNSQPKLVSLLGRLELLLS